MLESVHRLFLLSLAVIVASVTSAKEGDPVVPPHVSLASLQISPAEWLEIGQAFTEAMKVIRKSGERRTAYLAKLKAQGVEEEPMS